MWCDLDWIVNPFWKEDLDFHSHIYDGFELDWHSKKLDWATACRWHWCIEIWNQFSYNIYSKCYTKTILHQSTVYCLKLRWTKKLKTKTQNITTFFFRQQTWTFLLKQYLKIRDIYGRPLILFHCVLNIPKPPSFLFYINKSGNCLNIELITFILIARGYVCQFSKGEQ